MAHHPFDWQPLFLAALQRMPVIQYALDQVGISRSTAHRARNTDKLFAEAWEAAMEAGIDSAEQEAVRRGRDGYEEPVIDRGKLVYRQERYTVERIDPDTGDTFPEERWRLVLDDNGQPVPLTVRKFSDAMLGQVLKARRAAYRVERTEVVSPDGSMTPMDDTTRATRLAQILAAAQARAAADEEPDDFSHLA
jgi:hypothetical protein